MYAGATPAVIQQEHRRKTLGTGKVMVMTSRRHGDADHVRETTKVVRIT